MLKTWENLPKTFGNPDWSSHLIATLTFTIFPFYKTVNFTLNQKEQKLGNPKSSRSHIKHSIIISSNKGSDRISVKLSHRKFATMFQSNKSQTVLSERKSQ